MTDYADLPPFPWPEATRAYKGFRARLRLTPALDEFAYTRWLIDNQHRLGKQLQLAPVPEDEIEAWSKYQFLRATEGVL